MPSRENVIAKAAKLSAAGGGSDKPGEDLVLCALPPRFAQLEPWLTFSVGHEKTPSKGKPRRRWAISDVSDDGTTLGYGRK